MDYRQMAERLLQQHVTLHQGPLNRELAAVDHGAFLLLCYLTQRRGCAYPKELRRDMQVSAARVAALLNHLESRGLLLRTPDQADNRQVLVTLTETGAALVHAKRETLVGELTELLAYLGPEDAQALLRIQDKVLARQAAAGAAENAAKQEGRVTQEGHE